jgi:hypothetical protein
MNCLVANISQFDKTSKAEGDAAMSAISGLKIMRNKVDAESVKGRLLSNLIEQMSWREDGDRSWAKHPTQNLPWLMNVQVDALAKIA